MQKDSIITTDRILAAFPNNYHKLDVFYKGPLVWRNRLCVPPSPDETLIVAGHSDYPVVDSLIDRYPNASWWATNVQTPRAHGLPLGITNDTQESEVHPVYGNLDAMVEVAHQPRLLRNLVYMNFSVDTYPTERAYVWNLFADKPWVTKGSHVPTLDGRKTFLTEIRNHSFVLCPRGYGVDTHRLWETLYMGSIPIVRSDIAHSGWTDLPILFVNSWTDVTYDFLQKEEIRIRSSSWNLKKLNVNYWIQQIQDENRHRIDSN